MKNNSHGRLSTSEKLRSYELTDPAGLDFQESYRADHVMIGDNERMSVENEDFNILVPQLTFLQSYGSRNDPVESLGSFNTSTSPMDTRSSLQYGLPKNDAGTGIHHSRVFEAPRCCC